MNEPWRVTLLGQLRVDRVEQTITRFRSQKIGGLLAFLACHPRQVHSREVLIEMFWPDGVPEAGRASLSTALSSLRHQLEPPGTPAGAVLRADRYSVSVNPAAVITDVAEFEQALREAAKAGSAIERAQLLSRAVNLYQGRLLPGFYEDWISSEQERLSTLYFGAVGGLIRHLVQNSDIAGALGFARKAASVDPQQAELHGDLMRLLISSGQPGAALRHFRVLERLLEEELGIEPAPPLRALARQIEMGTSGLPEPGEATPAIAPGAPAPIQAVTGGYTGPSTVTFLLTDIEGSIHLSKREGDNYRLVADIHHHLLQQAIARHGGREIKEADGAFVVAFTSATQALTCAISAQQALALQEWPEETGRPPGALKVRMALHTGDVEVRAGEYSGAALHLAGRMLTAGHGGQVLLSEATAGLVRRDLSADVHLMDLGIYRLPDVPAPERLFQVRHPGMSQEQFPPLRAVAGFATHLPMTFTRFFGREKEIAALQELLQTPEVRIVTLSGPGGTGKTRLSLQVAERLVEPFAGAVFFAPLADLSDPLLIPGAIVDALWLKRSPTLEPLEQAVEALNRQPSLLILDNFEQLVEKGGAEIVQTLLSRVPALTLLVTTRHLLGLAAEREFALEPLNTPNGDESPERLSVFESVQLFIDRAQTVKPDFQVTNANAAAVAELVSRLEGIPLAIELAAARAQVLTPAQMLSHLDQRFGFLVSRKRDVSERHRTLHAAVDWSYRLLVPELQRFFCRLSVFRGGWTAEGAETVCEEPLALDFLAQLRECSLVLSEEAEIGMRFRMLETLRDFGTGQLIAEERAVLQLRHAECFLALAEEAEAQLAGPRQGVWLSRLETEHDNLRAALTWLKSAGLGAETGLRLSGALAPFWVVRGHLSEGRARYIVALGTEGARERTSGRAKALRGAGELALNQGDYPAARTFYDEGLAIYRELGDKLGIATSIKGLGSVALRQGDYASAGSRYEESLAIYRELGNKLGICSSLFSLGAVAGTQGDSASARSLFEESLAIFRELGDTRGISYSLGNLGNVAHDQGDYAFAHSLHEESLAIRREIWDKLGIAQSLEGLANLARSQQQTKRSAQLYGAADSLRQALGASIPSNDLPEHIARLAALRVSLGKERFAAAWEAGRAMTWEQAVAYALAEETP